MALTQKLDQIDKLREKIAEVGPISKEDEDKLWQKFRLEWNYNSNHIEGNTLTYGETKLLLMFDRTTGDHTLREYNEMKAHDVAVQLIRDWASQERDLTEQDIRDLNKIILVEDYWKEAETQEGQETRRKIKVGSYKEFPNHVRTRTGEIFRYAEPAEVPQKMQELMAWYRENETEHPVVLGAQFHYKFILIHPFDDGNGRVARLIVNYILMKHGYPPIVIKSAEKDQYLAALNKADAGERSAFTEYIADCELWSMELKRKATLGEEVEEPDDVDKEIELLRRISEAENEDGRITSVKHQAWAQILEESFLPLFESLNEGVVPLINLFKSTNVNFIIGQSTQGPPILPAQLSRLKRQIEDLKSTRPDRNVPRRYSIQLGFFDCTVPRSTLLHFHLHVVIRLSDKEYQVSLDGTPRSSDLVKAIPHHLSEYEIKNLVQEAKRLVVRRIEKSITARS